jgi:protein phosphatase 2C
VLGVLAVSRALGDVCLKPSVTPQPRVASAQLPPGQRAALLLYCDGVSNVCTDAEAAQCVADALAARAAARAAAAAEPGGEAGPAWDGTREGGGDDDAAAAAEALVTEAMRRGTRDNVTVLAVLL